MNNMMKYQKYLSIWLEHSYSPPVSPLKVMEGRCSCIILCVLVSCFLLFSCRKETGTITPNERKKADSIVRATHGTDSLSRLQNRLEREGNRLGSIVALREWGKALRNESRFEEALRVHSKGLQQAETIGDTIEWVQALNNIGTDYRRLGMLDVAQEYHYNAWKLSEESTDTSFMSKKNRVVSLNGLGNIYLALGNYMRADSVLRMALKGEQELNSTLGQAINYANLGAIFEYCGKEDSAWVYYRKSMALNIEAGNDLGISLCHTYFGSLYEKTKLYDKAKEEYESAYRLMQTSKDGWHALNSLVALAGIYHAMGNGIKAMEHLDKAKHLAEVIKSPEHLGKIYTLYYKHFKQQGDSRSALAFFEQAVAMQESVLDMEMVNRIQNASLTIERKQQEREKNEIKLRLEQERTAKHTGYVVLVLVVLSLLGLVALQLYIQRIRKRNHLSLKRLSSLREEFFTNITHEFRTPLTVILGLSHDLQSPEAKDVKDKARTIEQQGNRLLTLINQLLDISKIKSAVGDADWRSGNITAHLMMIVEAYRDYARTRNIDLQFLGSEVVEMDFVPDYVNKVINNLLSNAFKFTPEYGRVIVSMRREEDRLLVNVEDTGEGMDEETLDHIFEPFYQGEGEAKNIGTGVGLALVKQIMDAVEGSITVESKVGRGTIFHLSVPVRNGVGQRSAAVPEINMPLFSETEMELADSEGEDNQCRLLIIEDNRDIAAYIGSLFSDRYAVSYAENGKTGLEKAQELVPDLIITDLMMPGMDGLEMCRQVRGNEITDHIPIIVVTAKITEEERIKGLEAGADAYIAKPFNADEMRTRVEKLLDRHRRLHGKYSKGVSSDKNKNTQLKDAERRFLAKTVDIIYQLMDKRQLDVNTLADKLCMSPRQLYRKLVGITGNSPSSYILGIKMQRACHLLKTNPGLTIEEIADRCGFEYTPNFYNSFKKMYGITPLDYRRGISI